jgi:glutaredoxin
MYTLYTKEDCPNCDKAKNLLRAKGIPFETLMLGEDFSRDELIAKIPTARMMPQIMKDGVAIGSFNELRQLLS